MANKSLRNNFNKNSENNDDDDNKRKKSFLSRLFGFEVANKGWSYNDPPPKLSPARRKELMEATALDTPRSTFQAVWGILKPYWTKAGPRELAIATTLLATTIAMTWFAVQVTVDFGHWQSQLINTIQEMYSIAMQSRPELIESVITNYPNLQDIFAADPNLKEIFTTYPNIQGIASNPDLQTLFEQNPDFKAMLEVNPSLKDLFMNYPGIENVLENNPGIAEEVSRFSIELGDSVFQQPAMQERMERLGKMVGSDFLGYWGDAAKASVDCIGNWSDATKQQAANALSKAWSQKDFVTIALKFTAMAVTSYTAAQFLALRWRVWTTGYYVNKWMKDKAYYRLKNLFNNIDNPDQRLQQDPEAFTKGSISILTGILNSAITLGSFVGMLWGMSGEFNTASIGAPEGMQFDIPGTLAWAALAYASAVTVLTYKVGKPMAGINRDRQKYEGYFRSSLKKVHENTDQIAQNHGEDIEKALMKKNFKPVIKNAAKYINKEKQLILIDSTLGNLSVPIPWFIGGFFIALGTASMGTVQTLNYAFNRVTYAMSFIVNRWQQLTEMKAVADRIYLLDRAIEASHYIEEEKRQQVRAQQTKPTPKPQI